MFVCLLGNRLSFGASLDTAGTYFSDCTFLRLLSAAFSDGFLDQRISPLSASQLLDPAEQLDLVVANALAVIVCDLSAGVVLDHLPNGIELDEGRDHAFDQDRRILHSPSRECRSVRSVRLRQSLLLVGMRQVVVPSSQAAECTLEACSQVPSLDQKILLLSTIPVVEDRSGVASKHVCAQESAGVQHSILVLWLLQTYMRQEVGSCSDDFLACHEECQLVKVVVPDPLCVEIEPRKGVQHSALLAQPPGPLNAPRRRLLANGTGQHIIHHGLFFY